MKRKIVVIILFVCCGMCFMACTNEKSEIQFDLNSLIEFDYSCADENKDFNFILDAEKSKEIIIKLNKITYVEVNEKIIFKPSYDCLRIIIGNDTLDLYDAKRTINNGGYITYNGKLYETSDNFVFLLDYINLD